MKTLFNTMIVSLIVTAINEEQGTCNVRYQLKDGDKAIDVGHLEDVFMSGLARYRFKHGNKLKLNHVYSCENNSKDYEACPIKLIRTADKDGKLIFIMKIVHEGADRIEELATPNGSIVKLRKFVSIPKDKWMRYSDYYDRIIARRKEQYEEMQNA